MMGGIWVSWTMTTSHSGDRLYWRCAWLHEVFLSSYGYMCYQEPMYLTSGHEKSDLPQGDETPLATHSAECRIIPLARPAAPIPRDPRIYTPRTSHINPFPALSTPPPHRPAYNILQYRCHRLLAWKRVVTPHGKRHVIALHNPSHCYSRSQPLYPFRPDPYTSE
jgi:hypothetical protein